MSFSEFVSCLKSAIKVIYEPKVGVGYPTGHASSLCKFLTKDSVDLIETFENINTAPRNLIPIVSVKLVFEGSIIPCVDCTFEGYSSIDCMMVPLLDPFSRSLFRVVAHLL